MTNWALWGNPAEAAPGDLPVVFLPGWACSGRMLSLCGAAKPWWSTTTQVDPSAIIPELHHLFRTRGWNRVVLVGWSMGARLALEFAGRNPARVQALVLLAMRKSWPEHEIEAIRHDLRADPATFLRDFYRKCLLGRKGQWRQFVDQYQDQELRGMDPSVLAAGLSLLQTPLSAAIDTLHRSGFDPARIWLVHGENDIIAPCSERMQLAGAAELVLKNEGHALFLTSAVRNLSFLSLTGHNGLLNFNQKNSKSESMAASGSKSVVQRKFDRAATTYDRFADVQNEVAERLIGYLPAADCAPEQIIELGCGTGNLTARLQERYPCSSLTAVDFASEMIRRAVDRLQHGKVEFFGQDIGEFLASRVGLADLLVSNATLQWVGDLESVISLVKSRLAENGLFAFSVFGPESLAELQEALDAVLPAEGRLTARSFRTRAQITHLLQKYFSRVETETAIIQRKYPDVLSLLRQIRKTGTAGERRAPMPLFRRHLAEIDAWFKGRYGGCRASYQVMFFRCRP